MNTEKILAADVQENPGYHIRKIPRGEMGKSSKILEEVMELIDAEEQNCKIMALVELSDLVGAIEAYLERNHPSIELRDLIEMTDITKRAFKNGYRR